MKTMILVVAFVLSACASAKKETTTAAPAKTATETKEAAKTANAKDKKAAATEKAASTERAKPVKATVTADSVGDTIECKSGSDVRKLVISDKGAGCEVEYTKNGETKVIGGAEYERSVCTNVVAKVRGTLETAGYTCN